jgi:MFS family permease
LGSYEPTPPTPPPLVPARSAANNLDSAVNQISAAVRLINSFVASFHPRALPPMLRANYSRELVSWLFLPMMLGAVEGGAISIIVKKAFDGAPGVSSQELDYAVAIVGAAPNIGNLTSFLWAAFSHGRPKVAFISSLQIATAVLVALIATVPETRGGLYAMLILVTLGRITWTGVVTIRTAIWGANYPRADRARIAGKMATVQSLSMAAVGALIGVAMDFDEQSFHWLFPLAAIGGLVGNAIYRKVRLRGQRRLARAELAHRAATAVSINPISIYRVLREDAPYRRFMIWMFIFGLGNLMLTAPLAIVLSDEFNVSYWGGIQILGTIPMVLMPLVIPVWSKLLDRRHVVEFRAIHAWSFVAAAAAQFFGAAFHQLWLFYAGAVINGVAHAGGVLAWNLGHHDFAPEHRDSEYMGVHVTLNGLRGLIAPFLAVWIYQVFDQRVNGSGIWVFAVCLVLNLVGAIGFLLMRRDLRRGTLVAPHKVHRPHIRHTPDEVQPVPTQQTLAQESP